MEKEENIVEENGFYTAAAEYWEHIPPTVDGMLGGFGFISQIDIKGSTRFLKSLFEVCVITTTVHMFVNQFFQKLC